ncbi:serine protease [uncultured Roseovarius sp.]|uniref:S1C family serine protease n=1 Tax=uncultured Roseovarius sp. TaxID=293344 RepID=UPI002599FE9C|nr:serine protease [uncultured Roseovarius sp.]
MSWRTSNIAFLFFLAGIFPFRSNASEFFKSDSCAIIVASRASLSEARQWIIANGWEDAAQVYLGENGWYAIAVAEIPTDAAQGRLSSGKASGLYPSDSYCSSGRHFVREVAWAIAESTATDSPSDQLWNEFDARPFTRSEKVFIQSGLALQGEYTGLLDGVWGSGSQRALERFTRSAFDREPLNSDAALLSLYMFQAIEVAGWKRHLVDNLAVSIILPMKALRLKEREGNYESWEHETKDIYLIFNDLKASELSSLHDELANDSDLIQPPYTVRQNELWVTSGRLGNGTFYARSDLILGTWSTSVVFAGAAYDGEIALITSSIKPNVAGLFLPEENGLLVKYTDALREFLEEPNEGNAAASPRSNTPLQPDAREQSTGTGFLINSGGIYLTNAHVVKNCSAVRVGGEPADTIAVSSSFDLAALAAPYDDEARPLAFARSDIGLNADVTIAGFPLHGLLGGLNVSRGSISAMKGIGGDETTVQISAPVQPGNSGGPMIDRFGNVVGVVVAKLDAVEVANVTGDIAQNVNFAIRGSIAKIFLQTNGIEYSLGPNEGNVAPDEAAQILQSATKLVECGSP